MYMPCTIKHTLNLTLKNAEQNWALVCELAGAGTGVLVFARR